MPARLPGFDAAAGCGLFSDFARQLDLPHNHGAAGLSLRLPSGQISVSNHAGGRLTEWRSTAQPGQQTGMIAA